MSIEIKRTVNHNLAQNKLSHVVETFTYCTYLMKKHNREKLLCVLTDSYIWHFFMCK